MIQDFEAGRVVLDSKEHRLRYM